MCTDFHETVDPFCVRNIFRCEIKSESFAVSLMTTVFDLIKVMIMLCNPETVFLEVCTEHRYFPLFDFIHAVFIMFSR